MLDGFQQSPIQLDALGLGERDLLMGMDWLSEEITQRDIPAVLSNISCPSSTIPSVQLVERGGVQLEFYSFVSPSSLEMTSYVSQLSLKDQIGSCTLQNPIDWLQSQLAPKGTTPSIRIAFADLSDNEIDSIAPYMDIVIETQIGKTIVPPQMLDEDSVLMGLGHKGKNVLEINISYRDPTKGFGSTDDGSTKQTDLSRRQHRVTQLQKQIAESTSEVDTIKLQRQLEYATKALEKVELEIAALSDIDNSLNQVVGTLNPLNRDYADFQPVQDLVEQAKADISALERALENPEQVSFAYVGSAKCKSCHSTQYDSWAKTEHAHAWDTLRTAKREMDAACFSCHSTGGGLEGGPQRPSEVAQSNVENPNLEPHLGGVGCESCHGAGDKHLLTGATSEIRRMVSTEVCTECHNGIQDNGEFDPVSYRMRIVHDQP